MEKHNCAEANSGPRQSREVIKGESVLGELTPMGQTTPTANDLVTNSATKQYNGDAILASLALSK